MLFFVCLLVGLDEGHEIDGALPNEYNVAIFETSRVVIGGNHATLSDAHRFIQVILANLDASFSLCLECHNRIVIQPVREIDMIGVTPVRQISILVKRLVPRRPMHRAPLAIQATICFHEHLDARENFAR